MGDWLKSYFQLGLDMISGGVAAGLEALHVAPLLNSLIVDGIIAGVGGILLFLPNIFILFLALAFLEDSGYMSRVAYVMDSIMLSLIHISLPQEQEACIGYLRNQFALLRPKILVCLGRIAGQKLIKPDLKITKEHGIFFDKGNTLMMATLHPAALLRNPCLLYTSHRTCPGGRTGALCGAVALGPNGEGRAAHPAPRGAVPPGAGGRGNPAGAAYHPRPGRSRGLGKPV